MKLSFTLNLMLLSGFLVTWLSIDESFASQTNSVKMYSMTESSSSDDDDHKIVCGEEKDDDSHSGDDDDHKYTDDDDHHSGDDDDHKTGDCPPPVPEFVKPLGNAHVIFENTRGESDIAVMTNLTTSTSAVCDKTQALINKSCNSFGLGSNDIIVVQNDNGGNLTKMIGVSNTDSTSYANKGTDNQLDYFSEGKHLFDIPKIRGAADKLSLLSPALPSGSYGTISFKQFIENVSLGRPMYGIVRVKVPLVKNTGETEEPEKESDDDDYHEDGHKGGSYYGSRDDDSDDESNKYRYSSKDKYRMCGEKPTPECSLCGPDLGTNIKPGNTICGYKISDTSKVNVFGSIMFDWVDCKSQVPIVLSDMPKNPEALKFKVSVPININPANANSSNTAMKDMISIANIVGSNKCPQGSPCNLPITSTINYGLVSDDAKKEFLYDNGYALTQQVFDGLSQSGKFSLLFPSGYEKGWAVAFSKLGITADGWKKLGFNAPDIVGILSENDIRNERFEDIPVYMYTGGMIDMHHHVNISGLVYVPQSMELEQLGKVINNSSFEPSHQYFSGAIIVRDSFYIEARYEGGITIISNNPNTYATIELDSSSGNHGRFQSFPSSNSGDNNNSSGGGTSSSSGGDSSGSGSSSGGGNSSGGGDDSSSGGSSSGGNNGNNQSRYNPGPQWIEVRPQ